MNDFNRPQNEAEKLMWDVYSGRAQEAREQSSRLRLENMLRATQRPPQRRAMPLLLKIATFICALLVLGSWAGSLSVPGYDDGQQITIELPRGWVPAQYPYWVGLFSKHADGLLEHGGHSLVVDYSRNSDGSYYLQLGLIGVDYQQANEWIRSVMATVPDVNNATYSITQPMVRYRVRVADMIAYKLGSTEAIERNVVLAWLSTQHENLQARHVYLIAQPKDYAKRVSRLDF
jgi:hypothetical protein